MGLTVIAGIVSTVLFALSNVPMLRKAMRTRDMASYSVGNLVMSNIANAVHSVYVFSLPAGPIWFLHTFYMVAAAIMLILYLSPVPGTGTGVRPQFVITQAPGREPIFCQPPRRSPDLTSPYRGHVPPRERGGIDSGVT